MIRSRLRRSTAFLDRQERYRASQDRPSYVPSFDLQLKYTKDPTRHSVGVISPYDLALAARFAFHPYSGDRKSNNPSNSTVRLATSYVYSPAHPPRTLVFSASCLPCFRSYLSSLCQRPYDTDF
ncbi:hypothetical protein FA95DRAFT_1284205 [Auriscalpium vulgare]|uniref:Uncharacterized protein n=1 Tax=Auriscalpium vulgare TaxID=40419 RepID=A0ACB8R271_9AGAM|nr:hypothetical protein FA95DRAFT_1284205 [Auriscalpium vulgare]